MLSLRLPISHSYGTARAPPSSVQCPPKREPTQMTLVRLELLRLQLGVDLGDELVVVLEVVHHLVERDAAARVGVPS